MGCVCRELCTWEVGGMSGMVTDVWETFRLDNLESEIVGGACGLPERGGVSKNGSNKSFT